MNASSFSFKETNKYIGKIILVGIALGIANFGLGIWPTLGQSIFQQVIISLVIGYSLFIIIYNYHLILPKSANIYLKYFVLFLLFSLLGFIGSEVEFLVKSFVFQQEQYQLFNGSGTYLFNAILTCILGFATHAWTQTKDKVVVEEVDLSSTTASSSEELLNTIPIKRGEATFLHSIQDIIYFEAYDNYSFLFDLSGKKHLCNYSLLFLEKKLSGRFLRVHRKYLINKSQISQIKPHLKGRYVIEFRDQQQSSITSSSSYAEVIKSIIKL